MVLSASNQQNMFTQATPCLTTGSKILHPSTATPYYSNPGPLGAVNHHPSVNPGMAPPGHSFTPASFLPPAAQLSPSYGWGNYPYNMWQQSAQFNSVLHPNPAFDFLHQAGATGQPSPVGGRSDSGYSQDSPRDFSPPSHLGGCVSSPESAKSEHSHSAVVQSVAKEETSTAPGSCCRFSPTSSSSDATRISQSRSVQQPRPAGFIPAIPSSGYGSAVGSSLPSSASLAAAFPCPNFPQRDSGIGLSASCYLPSSAQLNMDRVVPEYSWMRSTRPSGPGTNNVRVRTRDKYRMVYSDYQRIELEKEFYTSKYINTGRKTELSRQLGLTERQIKIWFQNRRAKDRKCIRKNSTGDSDPDHKTGDGDGDVHMGTVKSECTSTCKEANPVVPSPFYPTPGLFSSTPSSIGHFANSLTLPDSSSFSMASLSAGSLL